MPLGHIEPTDQPDWQGKTYHQSNLTSRQYWCHTSVTRLTRYQHMLHAACASYLTSYSTAKAGLGCGYHNLLHAISQLRSEYLPRRVQGQLRRTQQKKDTSGRTPLSTPTRRPPSQGQLTRT
ncbi:hypothetical protein Lal_00046051 [Lupinus albus]|nr:hypothetical protein Lal_00046051 [Lupinus albus]